MRPAATAERTSASSAALTNIADALSDAHIKVATNAKTPQRVTVWGVLMFEILVAGAGSNLHLLPEQVKMVAGTGIDHNLQSAPVKMVAGGRTHLNLLFQTAA